MNVYVDKVVAVVNRKYLTRDCRELLAHSTTPYVCRHLEDSRTEMNISRLHLARLSVVCLTNTIYNPCAAPPLSAAP